MYICTPIVFVHVAVSVCMESFLNECDAVKILTPSCSTAGALD